MSFFGKNRKVKSTEKFASPDYVKISFAGSGGASSGLANAVRGSLQQTVTDLYIIGEPTVFFSDGPVTGNLSIGRYAECGNLFKGIGNNACGIIQSIQLQGAGGAGDGCSCGGVGATFEGAKLTSVGFDIQAGNTFISETIEFKIADIS
jgi:hypothetical protein